MSEMNDDDVSRFASGTMEEENTCPHAYITDALEQLSIDERELVTKEIRGAEDGVEESQEMLDRKFREMKTVLSRLKAQSPAECAGLVLAETQSAAYVYSPLLLRRFLLAERFRATEASIRMLKYYNLKLQFFGRSKLSKDIAYSDLHPEDIITLQKGVFQILPERDQSGRAVVFVSCQAIHDFKSIDSFIRVRMYQQSTDDEETLKNGVVYVVHSAEDEGLELNDIFGEQGLFRLVQMARNLREAMPVRVNAIHFCCKESGYVSFTLDLFLKVMDKDSRCRTRVHHGPELQLFSDLLRYGIPVKFIPVCDKGVLQVKNHRDWIEMRRKHEELQKTGHVAIPFIEIPSQKDFLVGKGRAIQAHKGNIRLHRIIDERLHSFDSAIRTVKTQITSDIVSSFKAEKGRFLSRVSGVWTEISDENARERIAQLFRSRRKLKPTSPADTPTCVAQGGRNRSDDYIQDYAPSPSDFLVGQGKSIQGHAGNMKIRSIIDCYLARFGQSNKTGKTNIAFEIVSSFKADGGRFLSQESGVWVEVSDEVARGKIAQLFRSRRKLKVNPSALHDDSDNRLPMPNKELGTFPERPAENHFLLGKGKPIQGHTGNIRMHGMIDEHLHQFDNASKDKKSSVAAEMVSLFKSQGGSFMSQQENGLWMEVSDESARQKVAQLFRSRRKLKRNSSSFDSGGDDEQAPPPANSEKNQEAV